MIRFHLVPLVLLLLVLAAPPAAGGVDLATADETLQVLAGLLKSSRSASSDILDALDATAEAYHGLTGPVAPEPTGIPDDATPEQRAQIEEANSRLQSDHQKAVADYEKAAAKWRKSAEKQFLKAFALTKVRGELNLREDVNVRAARIIGDTGNPGLWKAVKSVLEGQTFKVRNYEVSADFLEAAFKAVASLGDPDALVWMAEDFIHTNSSPEKVVDRLVAAQKSLVEFPRESIKGPLRFAIVQKMVKLYASTESVARQSSNEPGVQAVKRFWDRIRRGVISAAQHYAGMPRNEEGQALASMQEFSAWFRDHKNPRRAPWTDPKEPRE